MKGKTMTDMLDGAAVKEIATLAKYSSARTEIVKLPEPIPGLPSSVPVLIDPANGMVKALKSVFDEYKQHPARKTGTARVETLDSFIDLTNRHKTEHSALFGAADWRKPGLTAVIDYHKNDDTRQADWANHKIDYQFPLSEDWKVWLDIHGKPLTQADFAEFIELHIPECAAPTPEEIKLADDMFSTTIAAPNKLITLSRGLAVMAETKVINHTTLRSGEGEITFEETHKDAAGGKLDVPGLFVISVPPFFNGEMARILVRLRYRVAAGAIKWTMLLFRPDQVITAQVDRDMAKAAEQTGLPLYIGAPEK
jgi:uncharacterized protein YfdQ (DUF2303 family)